MKNFASSIKNRLYKFLSVYFGKDYLWRQTQRRLFFLRLAHFIGLILFSYSTLSYFQYISENEERISVLLGTWKYADGWITNTKGDLAVFLDFDRSITIMFFYFVFCILFHFTTFFSKGMHELFYGHLAAFFCYGSYFVSQSTWDLWYFFEVYVYKQKIGFFIYNYIMFASGHVEHFGNDEEAMDELEMVDEEDEDALAEDELFIHRNAQIFAAVFDHATGKVRYNTRIRDTNIMSMPITEEYRGALHELPSIYEVDPAGQIDELIEQKKELFKEIQPGGSIYLEYMRPMGNFFVLYPDKTVHEQYVLNYYRWLDILAKASLWPDTEEEGETYIELEARYYRTLVIQHLNEDVTSREEMLTADDEDIINDHYEKYIGGHIYLDPWNSSAWFEGRTSQQCAWYTWWVSDQVPYFIKVLVLLRRFFKEYKLARIRARSTNSTINFMECLYTYFEFPIENKKYILRRLDGTYIAWFRGRPKVMTPDVEGYDPDIYVEPEKKESSILTQVKTFFNKCFSVIKSISLFFFKLFTHWGTVDFWRYTGQFIIRLPLYFFKSIMRFLMKIYKFFYRSYLYIFVKIMPPFYYILLNIYYLWFMFTRSRLLTKKVEPAGPYSVYNPFQGIKHRFIKLGIFRFFLWKIKTRKMFNLKRKDLLLVQKRKLFLLWSSNKINKK